MIYAAANANDAIMMLVTMIRKFTVILEEGSIGGQNQIAEWEYEFNS